MFTTCVLICLIILTNQQVHCKVITINTTGGSDSNVCCVKGECPCSSLSTALHSMTNNTVINITSQSVTLHGKVTMGSGHLTNITITGNAATIMCNSSGSVQCDWCSDVIIERITWDKCGYNRFVPGVTFNTTANITIMNCTFQHSEAVAVNLSGAYENVIVKNCNFLSNRNSLSHYPAEFGALYVDSQNFTHLVNLLIDGCNFSNNGFGLLINQGYSTLRLAEAWNITISQINFRFNLQPCAMYLVGNVGVTVVFDEVYFSHNIDTLRAAVDCNNCVVDFQILQSSFNGNTGSVYISSPSINVLINNTNITDNIAYELPIISLKSDKISGSCSLTLENVNISYNYYHTLPYDYVTGFVSLTTSCEVVSLSLTQVTVMSNIYRNKRGGAVAISSSSQTSLYFKQCMFINNTGIHGAAVYIEMQYPPPEYDFNCTVVIISSVFDRNLADDSLFYLNVPEGIESSVSVDVYNSSFTNNFGACMFIQKCALSLFGDVLFKNNSAKYGGALYIGEACKVDINGSVQFIDNSAVSHGGAIYVELNLGCHFYPKVFQPTDAEVLFINTMRGYGGNSLYFSVSKYCTINLDYLDPDSVMYTPYQFKYVQVINGTMVPISSDYNYTQLNITHFPVVTSPYQLILYGSGIKYSDNVYFMAHRTVGIPVTFNSVLLDYFDKPAEVTEFRVQCIDCKNDFTLVTSQLVIDNSSPLIIILLGKQVFSGTNVTLHLLSNIDFNYHQIEVTLIIELVPCPDHPGYVYSTTSKGCVCYHHDVVECYDDYNEIKRGYWFGSVNGKATTSLCPNEYCRFVNHKETTEGYFELPDRVNDQCEHRRSGPACGECSPGYTLAYDSTDCISVDHCSTGMTVLVVVLTCLYWIALVGGLFILMYFKLSSGYLYGVIYYYSMIAILLSNNPNISSGASQFIDILSGFAQLTPKFLGQLCLVQGISRIDQLFVNYCHVAATSVLLLAFQLVSKCFRRISVLISRYFIRVFCFLLLLAYTSLVSSSLQLLRPLKFTDINDLFTYASPSFKYFQGRHVLYGSVALICELLIGVGLPLFLLLATYLIRQCPAQLLRVRSFLDQFQGCYKERYRWFAGYYLMCRQVIMLVVFLGNSNYYNMLFYLQTTCIIIFAIHMWFQPYRNIFLNLFDGIILLLMVMIVSICSFKFLQSAATELALILVTIPLVMLFVAGVIMKVKQFKRYRYVAVNEEADDTDDVMR